MNENNNNCKHKTDTDVTQHNSCDALTSMAWRNVVNQLIDMFAKNVHFRYSKLLYGRRGRWYRLSCMSLCWRKLTGAQSPSGYACAARTNGQPALSINKSNDQSGTSTEQSSWNLSYTSLAISHFLISRKLLLENCRNLIWKQKYANHMHARTRSFCTTYTNVCFIYAYI